MKSVLLRHYAADNLGDDLFVKVLAERYLDRFVVRRYRNNSFEDLENVRAVGGPWAARASAALERVTRRNNPLLRRLARSTDLMVYVGGSIFIDTDDEDYARREEAFFRDVGIPYYILGANYGPEVSLGYRAHVGRIFASATDVCLRDHESYERFEGQPNVRVATDMVFALDTSRYDVRRREKAVVSVIDAAARFSPEVSARYESFIVEAVESLAEQGFEVELMSFCRYEGDLGACKKIASMLPEDIRSRVSIHSYEGDIDRALASIAECSAVVGTRFHAVMLGLMFGKPVLPISYSHKTTSMLADLGYCGRVFDPRLREPHRRVAVDDFATIDVTQLRSVAEGHFAVLDQELNRR